MDAAAFVGTAVAVLMINAVAAISIGCSFHVLHYVYRRVRAGDQAALKSPLPPGDG